MLRQILSLEQETDDPQILRSSDAMNLIQFSLQPAGVCDNLQAENASLKSSFSKTVLETMKLLLQGSMIRKQSSHGESHTETNSEISDIQRLMGYIDELYGSGKVLVGGFFPLLIAQKGPMV